MSKATRTTPRVAVIAGREYTLRFGITDREALDKELGTGLMSAMVSGLFAAHVTILLHGLKHKYPNLGRAKLIKLLEAHVEGGHGHYDRPVRQAFWAAMEAGLIGEYDVSRARELIKDPELEPEPGDEEDEPGTPVGKDVAAGPRAVAGPNGY